MVLVTRRAHGEFLVQCGIYSLWVQRSKPRGQNPFAQGHWPRTGWAGTDLRPQDPDPRPQHPALPAQSWAWAPSGRQWWQAFGGFWNLPTALGMWTVGVPEMAKIPSLTQGASVQGPFTTRGPDETRNCTLLHHRVGMEQKLPRKVTVRTVCDDMFRTWHLAGAQHHDDSILLKACSSQGPGDLHALASSAASRVAPSISFCPLMKGNICLALFVS